MGSAVSFVHTKSFYALHSASHSTSLSLSPFWLPVSSNSDVFQISSVFTIIFVLYVCETWSLTLREERRLRAFEDRVLSRIFGPKRDEVTGEWRKA